MQATVIKSDLARLLSLAKSFPEKDAPLPILKHALLTTTTVGDARLLRITASDLNQTITAHALCSSSEPGSIAVSAQTLADTVGVLPEGPVTLRVDGTRVVVGAGKRSFKLPFETADNFPKVYAPDPGGSSFQISASELLGLLERVRRSAATDEAVPVVSSVLLEIGEGRALAAAMNGHRVAVARADYTGDGGITAVIPIRAIRRLTAALEKHSGNVLICRGAGGPDLLFQFGSTQLATKTFARDTYPGFEQTLQLQPAQRILLPRQAILESCSAVEKVFDKDDARNVVVEIGDGSVGLSTQSKMNRTCSDSIDGISYAGEQIKFKLNIDYLVDAVAPLGTKDVMLGYSSHDRPLTFCVPDSGEYIAVVSPCRLDG